MAPAAVHSGGVCGAGRIPWGNNHAFRFRFEHLGPTPNPDWYTQIGVNKIRVDGTNDWVDISHFIQKVEFDSFKGIMAQGVGGGASAGLLMELNPNFNKIEDEVVVLPTSTVAIYRP